jgi:hypothetical protein
VNTFRILILGAGFSKPAGLPLAVELFKEVRSQARVLHGTDNVLESDLAYYVAYLRDTEGFTGSADEIEVERFLSFLDVEHYLELRGSDTWSDEGNESQLLVRHTIGKILLDRTPTIVPDLYKYFASKLNPSDWILTFNYDTLLEQTLDNIGKSYRLFPSRYVEVNEHAGFATGDHSREEVIVLKLHGSIDWFHKSRYDETVRQNNLDSEVASEPIVDGPRFSNDPLLQICRVRQPTAIYANRYHFWQSAPFLLNPSHSKLLYSRPLIDFWRGWGRSGGLNLGLGVIGYSLPAYDDYACQVIYKIAGNYQYVEQKLQIEGRVKQPVRILDYRVTPNARASLRKRYRFMDAKRTKFKYSGLSEETIDWFME